MKTSLLYLLLLTSPCLFAQEGESSISEEEAQQNESDSIDSNDEELPENETDDDFVPTVQISEDLSVSFPVDI